MQTREKLNSAANDAGDAGAAALAGPAAPARLRPEMASFRLLVLAFVRDYFAQWQGSPSIGEIAHGLDAERSRVRRALARLARQGLLLRRPGTRGLALPDDCAEAVRTLRAAGWAIDEGAMTLGAVESVRPGTGKSAAKGPLPGRPRLDYRPEDERSGHKRQRRAGP